MNLLEMSKKRIVNKDLQRSKALAGAREKLMQESAYNSAMISEAKQDNRSNAISSMAKNYGTSRQGSRRKILAEKTKFRNTLRDKLFMESIFSIFMESLLLDEDFKETYKGNFYELTENMVGDLFASGELSYKSIMNEGSQTIKNVLIICEETADKEAEANFNVDDANDKKKVILNERDKEKNKDKDTVKMSKESKGDFEDKKSIETTTVAEAVKEKVVQVIRDEQEQSKKEQEISDEINQKIVPDEDDTLEENADSSSATADDKSIGDSGYKGVDPKKTSGGTVSESARIPFRKPNKVSQLSLFKSLQVNIANKNLAESQHLSESGELGEVSLDMDLVLAESLAYYTLLETLYTTRLINPSASDLRSFAKELTLTKSKK